MQRMTGSWKCQTEAVTAVQEITPERPLDEGVPVEYTFALSLGGDVFPLQDGENLIGRQPGCGVHLESAAVSRTHARLTIAGGQAILEDLGSKNGTFVDENRIDAPTEIFDTDALRFGTVWLYFHAPGRRGA